MRYLIIKHDYSTGYTGVDTNLFNSLQNAVEYIQDVVFNYITEKMGNEFEIHNHHRLKPASWYWNNKKFGYHCLKDTRESIYKLIIAKKQKLPGIVYDSYEMIPMYYYTIARYSDNENNENDMDYFYMCEESSMEEVERNKNYFDDVLEDLLSKFVESKEEQVRKTSRNYKNVVDELRQLFERNVSK